MTHLFQNAGFDLKHPRIAKYLDPYAIRLHIIILRILNELSLKSKVSVLSTAAIVAIMKPKRIQSNALCRNPAKKADIVAISRSGFLRLQAWLTKSASLRKANDYIRSIRRRISPGLSADWIFLGALDVNPVP